MQNLCIAHSIPLLDEDEQFRDDVVIPLLRAEQEDLDDNDALDNQNRQGVLNIFDELE